MRRPRRGFTLIELLLVVTVLGILLAFLAPRVGRLFQRGRTRVAQALLARHAAMIDDFENDRGDYPPDDFAGLAAKPPNDLNSGSESLVAHLFAADRVGKKPDEQDLVNTDDDRFPRKVSALGSEEAFELKDAWDNPVAYFSWKGYGKSPLYRTRGRGGERDDEVEASRSRKTGGFLRPEDYQLISAGPDGVFGTDDDVAYGEEP